MMNQFARLKSLRAEIHATQFQIETLKLIASDAKPNEVLRPLIEADEVQLADLQRELATLTGEVTNAICAVLTEPLTRKVILAREVFGLPFDEVADRINRSSRWARKLHQRGLRQLTSAAR